MSKGDTEGGRSAEPSQWGRVESDEHQMNKLWRAPFWRMGSPPFPLSLSLSLSAPLYSSLFSLPVLLSSLLFSLLTVQFPPLASLLLPANCEWSLIIGPPIHPRSEESQRLKEETGMSKCYPRQQTARETEVTHNKAGRSSGCMSTGAAFLQGCADEKADVWIHHASGRVCVLLLTAC